jgi:CheY-like chemotaxis protein
MDGYEVARRLRERLPDERSPRLIALTGYGDEKTRQYVQKAGFTQYLSKPVDSEVLLTLLRTDA